MARAIDGETVITTSHLNAALDDVSTQFKRALDGHRSKAPEAAVSSIAGWE